MKSFENIDVKSVKEAVGLLQKFHQQKKTAAVVGGGSEYLQLMKDHVVEPDYLINLKTIPGLDYIKEERGGFRIGALAKLVDIEEHPAIREKLLILSDAAGEAASPQIRNAGTIAGNICQRPFCWYFRSSNFTCLRKGGQVCYTVTGDSRFHAILGAGPSYIVHPSDTARAGGSQRANQDRRTGRRQDDSVREIFRAAVGGLQAGKYPRPRRGRHRTVRADTQSRQQGLLS